MRHGLPSVSCFALIAAALASGPANAQSRPGWVDPPARSADGPDKAPADKAAEPASKAAESKPEPNPVAEPRSAEPRSAEPAPAGRAARKPDTRRMAGPSEETESRRPPRRLARTPPAASPVLGAPPPVPDARFPDWAGAAQRLTFDYLDSISAPNAVSIAATPRFYAERVQRFGRTVSLASVIAEKRLFVQRWPERRYQPQAGSTRTACNAAMKACIVHTTYDYRAESPARGARSQGLAELVLEISFAGERPVIVSESSRVLRRSGPGTLGAAPAAQRGA